MAVRSSSRLAPTRRKLRQGSATLRETSSACTNNRPDSNLDSFACSDAPRREPGQSDDLERPFATVEQSPSGGLNAENAALDLIRSTRCGGPRFSAAAFHGAERVPSSRAFAATYGVARITVT